MNPGDADTWTYAACRTRTNDSTRCAVASGRAVAVEPAAKSIVRHHQGPLRVAVLRFKTRCHRRAAVLVEAIGEVLMDTFANSPALRKRE